jgi:hypothetical protein
MMKYLFEVKNPRTTLIVDCGKQKIFEFFASELDCAFDHVDRIIIQSKRTTELTV